MNDERDIYIKREAIKTAYPESGTWAKKVDRMKPTQVVALYLKFKAQNKI